MPDPHHAEVIALTGVAMFVFLAGPPLIVVGIMAWIQRRKSRK